MTKSILFAIPFGLLAAACGARGPEEVPGQSSEALGATVAGPLTVTLTPDAALVQGTASGYTITLTNTTAATMTALNVSVDFVQTSLKATPAACVKLGGGSGIVICAAPSLAPGASIDFPLTIAPDVAGPISYTAAAAPNGGEVMVVTDDEVVAPGETDLQVTGSSNQGSPPPGSQYTYTFKVKNSGPLVTDGDVTFADALPIGVGFVGVTTSIGSCIGGPSVSCDLGPLGVGAEATIAIVLTAPSAPGTLVDNATALLPAGQTDRQPANNTASVTVTVK
jgi:uncharacterized repeat protein (TIGR01451 family)